MNFWISKCCILQIEEAAISVCDVVVTTFFVVVTAVYAVDIIETSNAVAVGITASNAAVSAAAVLNSFILDWLLYMALHWFEHIE